MSAVAPPAGLVAQGPMFLLGLGHGATHWLAGVLYIVLPLLREDLGLSYTQVGLLVTMFHASSFLANFGSGVLVDVTGRKVLLNLVSLVVGAVALALFGATAVYLLLCLLVGLIGATNNLWHPPAIAYLSARYPSRRGYALSIHATGASVGDMIAPIVAGALIVQVGWQDAAMLSTAPVFLVALVLAVWLLPGDRPEPGKARQRMALADYLAGVRLMLRDRAVLGLCLMASLRSMAQSGLLLFLPLYLSDVLQVSPVIMGSAVMAMHLGGVVVGPIAGHVSDRIGCRPVVMAGLAASTVTIAALTLVEDATVFIVAVSILGFVLYAVRPVIHSWMMGLAPVEMRGSATSLLFGTQSLLSMAMPLVGGLIADSHGVTAVFYFIALVMLLANLATLRLPAPAR